MYEELAFVQNFLVSDVDCHTWKSYWESNCSMKSYVLNYSLHACSSVLLNFINFRHWFDEINILLILIALCSLTEFKWKTSLDGQLCLAYGKNYQIRTSILENDTQLWLENEIHFRPAFVTLSCIDFPDHVKQCYARTLVNMTS